MAGRAEGKVAFITGAARGQGRSHAVRLAEEGADIIAVDVCEDVETVPYGGGTSDDLAETASQVEALDRRIITAKADVRDSAALQRAVDDGVSQLGRLDIVSANAGILSFGPTWEQSEDQWQTMIDINLNGVWRTCKAAIPHMIEGGNGGMIAITSSVAGLKGFPNIGAYATAKHGLVGLMRTLAAELAEHSIRVNSIHPTQVDTPMIQHEEMFKMFVPDKDEPTQEDFAEASQAMNAMPTPWLESVDISNAIVFLASEEARYITGLEMTVDAGQMINAG